MREPQFITVPKGTRPSMCRSCYKRGFWITTEKNKRPLLVDCSVDGASEPGTLSEGRGVAHFATCPYAKTHRKARAR